MSQPGYRDYQLSRFRLPLASCYPLRDLRKVIAAVQLNEQVALAHGLIALTRTTRTRLATSALRGVRRPRTHASFCGLLDAITVMAIAGSKATSGVPSHREMDLISDQRRPATWAIELLVSTGQQVHPDGC